MPFGVSKIQQVQAWRAYRGSQGDYSPVVNLRRVDVNSFIAHNAPKHTVYRHLVTAQLDLQIK